MTERMIPKAQKFVHDLLRKIFSEICRKRSWSFLMKYGNTLPALVAEERKRLKPVDFEGFQPLAPNNAMIQCQRE